MLQGKETNVTVLIFRVNLTNDARERAYVMSLCVYVRGTKVEESALLPQMRGNPQRFVYYYSSL